KANTKANEENEEAEIIFSSIMPFSDEISDQLELHREKLPWLAVFTLASLGLILFSVILFLRPPIEVAPSQTDGPLILFATITPTLDPHTTPKLGQQPVTAQQPIIQPVATISPTNRPYYAEANEMGQVMVLMYHRILYPETRYQRTPDNFRADLERLYNSGYYPVNFVDLLRGLSDVPPGKKPVVLTFDDSIMSQFHILADNSIDGNSGIGIMLNFHYEHPDDWPMKATFFILADDRNNYSKIFGQPKYAKAKLQLLNRLGMEIGSHTVTHTDLSVATSERIHWELGVSQQVIENIVPGYSVESMSVPFGAFPYTIEFLKSGQWGEYTYTYSGNAAAWGGPSLSPFDADFDIYKVKRIEVTNDSITEWLDHFDQHPDQYYTSDGDPTRLTYQRVSESASQQVSELVHQ
ncbi:polysaccharide deacetylase family protein, partial [Anaerolineales bacterium HSG24]|nr:polysaccharide deacetylase family protein [Anaerolineales bacterium HSG24]